MSTDGRDWIRDIVKEAVRKELKQEPQEVTLTSRTMAPLGKSFPATAEVRLPDNRQIEVSITVERDTYGYFAVVRELT